MGRLIDRDALLAAYDAAHKGPPGGARKLIEQAPTIDAVPLDKLCEWLETDCILSCVSCEHLFGGQWCKQHPELPYRCHRKEHWKDALTKWMEEQDGTNNP